MFCSVDDEELTARLREIEQRQRRLDGERADVVAEWDRRRAWADDGSASAAARLARETSVSGRTARERVRIAGRLRDMPCTHGALDDLGWPKARLLADSINPRTAESFARDEEVLVEQAHRLSVDQLALFLCHWRRLVDEDGANADADSMHANQYVHLTTSWNGEGFLNGRLDPESAAIVRSALDMIAEEIFRSDRHATIQSIANGDDPPAARTPSERDAEALVELARRAMATTAAADEGATVTPSRPTVVVHIDVDAHGEVLARLANGAPFPTHDAVRLACDAAVTRALSRNGSVPVDLGRTTREPSEAQRRALGTLWATCAHPSCDRPYAWCQLHHVWHWSQGGPTDIAWLLPLCSTHHRLHHRGVFDIARRPDGTFVFERPDGREIGAANPTITRLLAALRALGRTG